MIKKLRVPQDGEIIDGLIIKIVKKINELITSLNLKVNYEEPECEIKKE